MNSVIEAQETFAATLPDYWEFVVYAQAYIPGLLEHRRQQHLNRQAILCEMFEDSLKGEPRRAYVHIIPLNSIYEIVSRGFNGL